MPLPLEFPGLTLHKDSDSPSLSTGESVETWGGGTGPDFSQLLGGRQPKFDGGSLTFDGVDDELIAGVPILPEFGYWTLSLLMNTPVIFDGSVFASQYMAGADGRLQVLVLSDEIQVLIGGLSPAFQSLALLPEKDYAVTIRRCPPTDSPEDTLHISTYDGSQFVDSPGVDFGAPGSRPVLATPFKLGGPGVVSISRIGALGRCLVGTELEDFQRSIYGGFSVDPVSGGGFELATRYSGYIGGPADEGVVPGVSYYDDFYDTEYS